MYLFMVICFKNNSFNINLFTVNYIKNNRYTVNLITVYLSDKHGTTVWLSMVFYCKIQIYGKLLVAVFARISL